MKSYMERITNGVFYVHNTFTFFVIPPPFLLFVIVDLMTSRY